MQLSRNLYGQSEIQNMNIVVTGADGFIGGFLIPKLIENKHSLFLIGNELRSLEKRFGNNSKYFSHVDMQMDNLKVQLSYFSPDVVIHLAGYSTSSDTYEEMECLFNANILFLGKILDVLKGINLKCFIYTGSSTEFYFGDNVYNPAYLYSATKTSGRALLNYYSEAYDFKSIFVTPYNVYGGVTSQKKIIDILFDSLDSEHTANTTLGEQVLDFIHVSDLAGLYCKVVESIDIIPDKTNFNAGSGEGTSIRTIAGIIEKYSGKRANINWGGVPYRKRDIMRSVADIRNQNELLNWKPGIDLHKGIQMCLESRNQTQQ